MKTLKTSIFAIAAIAAAATSLNAQVPGARIPPRVDDHFQRSLVVNRIDLDEKINRPLVAYSDPSLYNNDRFPETQGVVQALFNGLKSGKYLAYDPDNLSKSLTYDEVLAKANSKMDQPVDEWIEEEAWPEEEEGNLEMDEMLEDNGSSSGYSFNTGTSVESDQIDVAPFSTVLEFIENRIFDKNRSAEIFDIQYIRLVWVDPGETLPDENFICVKYCDVLETLEATQWKNVHNDAEDRNMREIFEERIFTSFITNVRQHGSRTLADAEHERVKLLEFEHNLWSF
jgi:hypothetical protein